MKLQLRRFRFLIVVVLVMLASLPALAQDDVRPEVQVRPELGISFRGNGSVGVVINVVRVGSAAEDAGLLPGDVLVAINDEFVSFETLPEILGQYTPGETVRLDVIRDGETLHLRAVLGSAPVSTPEDGQRGAVLGIRVETDQNGAPVVAEVLEGSAAEKAGLEVDDVIVFLDGHRVETFNALRRVLNTLEPGDTVDMIVDRGGLAETLSVTLDEGEIPPETTVIVPTPGTRAYLGISLGNSDDIPMIMAVAPGSPAEDAGFEVGEVIRSFDRHRVRTVAELIELVQQYEPGDEIPIVLEDGINSRMVFVTLGRR